MHVSLFTSMHSLQVMKKPGVIIKPIEYEDVDPYKKGADQKQSVQKQKKKKGKRKQAN